jgi:hypothetical protein
MATPEQVEAVARAIVNTDDQMDCLWGDDPGIDENAVRVASAAIAAYEATKPVVSDEELGKLYDDAVSQAYHDTIGEYGEHRDEDAHLAGIRAVRARLEGE